MAETLPLSVLLLARDETRDIEELLPALSFAREVVVVWDPRGDRATRDAAERLGARVFERAFDGFGPQRRFALERCTQDWVLWIDADERLTPESVPTLRRAIAAAPAERMLVLAMRRTYFLGRRIRWCGWGGETLPRLFGRRGASFDDAPVHERVTVEGARVLGGLGPFEIEHHSYPTLDACVTKMLRYAPANAEKAWDQGRRAGLLDVALRPPLRFARQYVLQLGFLDGAHGLVLCAFSAGQVFLKYAALWDRTRRSRLLQPEDAAR
jgi:(heptosyl)LPS beta-1,4-glucosyltransferase